MIGEKFEKVHKEVTKIVKNVECMKPKKRLWYLVYITEHATVHTDAQIDALASHTPCSFGHHRITESQSNSGCKGVQEVSGPTAWSQQSQFDVRLNCQGLYQVGL